MYMMDESREKWNSTSYNVSERYDSEAKWMAFLSFLDVLPKDSRVFSHLVEFHSSAQCSRISVRRCWNQASQYGVQYPTHMLLKPEYYCLVLRWRIQWYARVYQSRDKAGSLYRPDLYSSTRCIIPYYYGSESSSLYTCNTSWRSVHYMILNKPLVRLTTAHYQSAVSMISFTQVLTAQWSDTIPCRNVWFQVRITSHDIPFQHMPEWRKTDRRGHQDRCSVWSP